MKAHYKWKVDKKPSGCYASFYKRTWPYLESNDDQGYLLAQIFTKNGEAYSPDMRNRNDLTLFVRVYDYSNGSHNRSSACSKDSFCSIKKAKEWAEKFFKAKPEYLPAYLLQAKIID